MTLNKINLRFCPGKSLSRVYTEKKNQKNCYDILILKLAKLQPGYK